MFGYDVLAAMVTKRPRVQRGIAASAGNITISAVNPDRTVVFSRSKGSAGYVAARGDIRLSADTTGKATGGGEGSYVVGWPNWPDYVGGITGGSTDLTVKEYSARLINATTISCDGPVEWQVIDFR